FNDPAIALINSHVRILWINGTERFEIPPGPEPNLFIAPARFLARRAINEWGFPAHRIVVIPGEATARLAQDIRTMERDDFAIVHATHQIKGLHTAVADIERIRADSPAARLDVLGSAMLHGDALDQTLPCGYPDWVRFLGGMPQREVEQLMPKYGVMLYLTRIIDGFSLATAEALSAGVVVIATDHGSNAEFIRHGWNGLLVSANNDHQPDLSQGEDLLRKYLACPEQYMDMRRRAAASVPSWDEQAARWERAWSTIYS